MKLQKITEPENETRSGKRRRWYDDACGTAMALELVGERWALMVVRELMFGARRFGDIRAALPGLSANILTQRLEGLEESGILIRRKLPPPASAQVYELTSWGYDIEPIIQSMGRWAIRSPEHDPSQSLSAASLMMSFRTMLRPDRALLPVRRIGFVMDGDSFVGTLDAEGIAVVRGPAEACDVVLTGSPIAIASIVYGGRPVEDAEAAGELKVEGNRNWLATFTTLFPLPAKVEKPS